MIYTKRLVKTLRDRARRTHDGVTTVEQAGQLALKVLADAYDAVAQELEDTIKMDEDREEMQRRLRRSRQR